MPPSGSHIISKIAFTVFGDHCLFCEVYVVSFRIPHYIFSGPVGIECFHELHNLFKLVPRRYVYEFAVFKLLEDAIHGTSSTFLFG